MVYNNKKHDTETQKAEMFDAVEWNPFYCSNALKNLLRPRCMPHTYVSFWCRNKMHMHGMAYPAHVRKHENVLPLKQDIFSHAWDSQSGRLWAGLALSPWPKHILGPNTKIKHMGFQVVATCTLLCFTCTSMIFNISKLPCYFFFFTP